MKEHPLLMTGPNVQSIRAGRKRQTRRVVKPLKLHPEYGIPDWNQAWVDPSYSVPCLKLPYGVGTSNETRHRIFPPWEPGDRIWLKETWRLGTSNDCACYEACSCKIGIPIYRADCDCPDETGPWRPSIFMPRSASRITLKIDRMRVERLNDISEEDATAEGVTWRKCEDFEPVNILGSFGLCSGPARIAFKELWDSINGKNPAANWSANPWVWVIDFSVL
jgi:hypothetical protein